MTSRTKREHDLHTGHEKPIKTCPKKPHLTRTLTRSFFRTKPEHYLHKSHEKSTKTCSQKSSLTRTLTRSFGRFPLLSMRLLSSKRNYLPRFFKEIFTLLFTRLNLCFLTSTNMSVFAPTACRLCPYSVISKTVTL